MSTARSDLVDLPGIAWPIELRPMANARTMRLRIDETRARLVLTHPRRISRRAALHWAGGQSEWADRQLAAVAPAIPFAPGSIIPIEGEDHEIRWDQDAPRTPQRGSQALICGGPLQSLDGRVERYLRFLARERASIGTAIHARNAGVTVKSVAVADTRSRWGSCSATGSIRYNWRLIMAPPDLFDWVMAHEVAHRVHMNHGPEFKALERRLYGRDPGAARAMLRSLGPRLKRIGRPV